MLILKRVYDEFKEDDGFRVLVDRLWPRGVSKEKAHVDLWLKDIAPSDALRKWFNHDMEKWAEFKKKYKEELKGKKELLDQLKELEKKHKKVTLLFGAKDEEHNQAVVLKEILSL
jgi:uncharacterized protein YeaO (DUF488 family)